MSNSLLALIRGAERLPILVVIKDGRLRWRYANGAARELFGLSFCGYQYRSNSHLLGKNLAAAFTHEEKAVLSMRSMLESAHHIDGRQFRFFRIALRSEDKSPFIAILGIEVSQTEDARQALMRQRDFYLALSEVNQALIREDLTPTADRVYEVVCRIIVQHTTALLSAIAKIDHENDCVLFVHHSEKTEAMPILRGLEIPLDANHPQGNGIVAMAVREERIVVANDVAAEPGLAPWRKLMQVHGVQSAIAIPVRISNRLELILVVYAGERNFFGAGLIRLLSDLADDLGFALHHRQQAGELKRLALFDALTDLPNRRYFFELIDAALSDRPVQKMVVLVMDINDFKFHNDLLGHEIGDYLLFAFANRLRSAAGDGGIAGRLGSDEFALLMPLEEDFDVNAMWQRVSAILTAPSDIGLGVPMRIEAATGYALYPQDGVNAETLVRRASMALQSARHGMPGQLCAYEPSMQRALDRRREILAQVGDALANQRIEPWFQPQIDVLSGEVVGFEALVRLRSAENELIEPDQYIDVVESDARLIRRLGMSMLASVGAYLDRLNDNGLLLPVSVNIGARHLLAPGFVDDLDGILRRYPLMANCLEIEITEWEKLDDVERIMEVLQAVRERGLGVVLDDFGSGYASVGSLRRLPLTTVKLDQDFVRDLPASVDDQNIVTAVVVAARGLGLRLIAEGVEADEHAELLGALGVRLMQGYAIARPMPLDRLLAWLDGWHCPPNWRQWVRPDSVQGSSLVCVGAWFGLRRWLSHPELGEPPTVRQFRQRMAMKEDFGCPPPLTEFRSLFIDLSERIEEVLGADDQASRQRREQLMAEVEAMGRLMRRAIGRSSLVG